MTLRQALEVAQGAISWWRSDGDPNEDVGDLKGAAARLARFLERLPEADALAEKMAAEGSHWRLPYMAHAKGWSETLASILGEET